MEEDNYKHISLSDSELSMVDEGIYTNIPTTEIDIDMSSEYSPTTEPISFSSSIKNYLPSQSSSPIQNQIDEAPLTLPIEYLLAARDWLISMLIPPHYQFNYQHLQLISHYLRMKRNQDYSWKIGYLNHCTKCLFR